MDVPWTKLEKWIRGFSRQRKRHRNDLATGYLEYKSIITRLFSNHRPLLRYYYTLDILSLIWLFEIDSWDRNRSREKNGRKEGKVWSLMDEDGWYPANHLVEERFE